MLEQRQYTAYYVNDPPDVATDRRHTPGLWPRVRRRPRGLDYPVRCNFRIPIHEDPVATSTRVPASDTQSSNLSLYATSSLPYFDGEVRNRGELPPTEEVVVT